MKILKFFAMAFLGLIAITSVGAVSAPKAEATEIVEVAEVKPEIKACDLSVEKCVDWFASEYGVSKEKLHYIVRNESRYLESALGDMNIFCPRTGKPVRSRGILQISECYYPDIPDSCAFNAECSLREMILLIKNPITCQSQWTECRDYYN